MSEVHHVVFDPDRLARRIDDIAMHSLDPDNAEQIAAIAEMLLGELLEWQRRHSAAWTLLGRCDAVTS